jgi:hypothetical protein
VETTRRYAVVVEPDEDGVSIATVPASPGVVEHGGTERYAVLQSRARVYPGRYDRGKTWEREGVGERGAPEVGVGSAGAGSESRRTPSRAGATNGG